MEFQVSEKGAVSIYWLNYRPFTLYADEWKAVFGATKMILLFIAAHHLQISCRCDDRTRQALRDALANGKLGDETRVGSLWCKRATTGAVSIYGMRRFPVALYCAQWLRVLAARKEIEAFIDANKERLSTKGCCVPRPKKITDTRPLREAAGADNIIRPMAARSSELR
jgi:hypothetical protein